MLDGDPERLGGLAGEIASAAVDRREREPERHPRCDVGGRDDGRLRVQRVEDRLHEEQIDASESAAICSAYVSRTWSNVTERKEASSTLGETESDTLSGPIAPAIESRPPGVRAVHSPAARRASRAPSRLISAASDSRAQVGLPDGRRV